ncbi:Protein ZBED8-like [Oopsacas minuta]|uniref:Protein ZBED8-like n=1 Tax=Oopsacas minuta TaxID=111878 RepID=A0AAV7KE79_9METZ|nr:Protein ZBED8-like [Oopsacas minuta]
MVNFIKSSAPNTRVFRLLCQELDIEHQNLLFCTEVRWLSRGNMLSRVYSLKNELLEFFERDGKEKSKVFFDKLSDKEWLKKLAYLNDIFFSRINLLNKSLQGRFTTVIDCVDKIRAFIMKLELWEAKLTVGKFDFFESLSATLGEEGTTDQSIGALVKAHLSAMRNEFQTYFPDLSDLDMKMIRNPFRCDVSSIPDRVQEEFVELVNDSIARDQFETLALTKFWCEMSLIYPNVADRAVKILLMFPSTYLCEQGFSALLLIKNKFRARLSVEADLRLALSKTVPRIDSLIHNMQAHPSH